jgi:hypothetical protein
MRSATRHCLGLCVAMMLLGLVSAPQALAVSPWWHLTSSVRPSTLKPGGDGVITARALNVGDAETSLENSNGEPTPVVLTAKLPPGVTVQRVSPESPEPNATLHKFPETNLGTSFCREPASGEIECTYEQQFFGLLAPYEYVEMTLAVTAVSGAGGTNVLEVRGGGAAPASLKRTVSIGEGAPAFGVEREGFAIAPEEEGGSTDARAGSHPFQLTTDFALNQTADTFRPPALAKDLQFSLPPGLVANAAVFPRCNELEFLTKGPGTGFGDLCPQETAVGVALLTVFQTALSTAPTQTYPVPVFNLTPKRGEPARFGFYFNGISVPIDFAVRTGGNYAATATVSNITELANLISTSLTIWGVPDESVHDKSRGWACLAHHFYQLGEDPPCNRSTQSQPPPFLTLPTSCATQFTASVTGDSWPTKANPSGLQLPAASYSLEDPFGRSLEITGCNQLAFNPLIEVTPDVQQASTATGLTVHVRMPQESSEAASGLASAAIKDITVALPDGVSINPAAANGLEACSLGLIGFTGFNEYNPASEPGVKTALFSPTLSSPFCPTASKVATVKIKTPLLTNPLEGALYLAAQNENPFGSLLAVYIVAEDPESGVLVKLPGVVHLTETGSIVTTFENSPELPFEDAEVHFFGGEHPPLATPSHCGTFTSSATFVPWSRGEAAAAQSRFEITSGPHRSACPGQSLPFSPTLTAGSSTINAGSFGSLTTTIGRDDGNQDIHAVSIHTPPGFEGRLTGVKLCPEREANEGTCSAESLIGETTVSAGVGRDPVIVTGGRVYLTEKYGGGPFGLSIVNPVKAGPFDLEHDTASPNNQPLCDCVVVRARIEVDPHTAELTVTTDAAGPHSIPSLIDGVPVHIRAVNVTINRPGFTFNPTNCRPLAITGMVTGGEHASATVSTPFQVANCTGLQFHPKFAAATSGRTSKAAGASLSVKLAYPRAAFGSQANIARVKVQLPKQLPSRLTTLQKACLAAVFEVNPAKCPSAAIVGHAKVVTPLLPVPLTGPAYFISHGGAAFPDLVMVLQGYGIRVDLVGTTFISKKGITSSTFKSTPDVPFSSFELTLPQGKFSALAAFGNLCKSKLVMPTELVAENGAQLHQSTRIGVSGCHRSKVKKAGRKKHRKRR